MPGKESPVKFASLLFFEKFNGASRDQGPGVRDQGFKGSPMAGSSFHYDNRNAEKS
jgi:hypothetical protein